MLQQETTPAPEDGVSQELDEFDQEMHTEMQTESGGHETYANPLVDPAMWVLIPFLLVLVIFWRTGVHKTLGRALDKRGAGIASELEQARAMREEAQELLAKYQRRQREAEEEAQGIIEQARRDAKRMAEDTREKLDEQLARRTQAAEDKIARAEAQAVSEIRNRTAEVSAAAAEIIVHERLDSQAGHALVDRAISDVRSRLN